MNMWVYDFLRILPNNQLKQLYRDVCKMRSVFTVLVRKNSLINYIRLENPYYLSHLHTFIINEITHRNDCGYLNYNTNYKWHNPKYRGLFLKRYSEEQIIDWIKYYQEDMKHKKDSIYKGFGERHDYDFLCECLLNLNQKGIILEV